MKVKINDRTVEIFEGARVGDVLRKFSPSEWKAVDSGKKKIVDRYGNTVSLNGELSGGEKLQIEENQ
jgi:sulfur carrier protein ThiS